MSFGVDKSRKLRAVSFAAIEHDSLGRKCERIASVWLRKRVNVGVVVATYCVVLLLCDSHNNLPYLSKLAKH